MEKIKKFLKDNKYELIDLFIVPLYMIFLSTVMFQGIMGIYRINIGAYLFTIFIFFVFNILFDAIFPKRKISKIIQLLLLYILTGICIVKYAYIGDPIFISDIGLLKNIGEISTLGGSSLIKYIVVGFAQNVFILLASIFIYSLSLDKKIREISIKRRIFSLIFSVIVIVVLLMPTVSLKYFVLNNLYGRNKQIDYEHKTKYIQYYMEESLLGGIYSQYLESKVTPPVNYNSIEIDSVLSRVSKNNKNNYENTNIIVLFSESFFDVDLLKDDIKFDKEISSNFHKLQSEGKFVDMISPTFGGLSSNVEFELLTGFSMNFFADGSVPFFQLYNSKSKVENSINIVKELKKNGYYTEVVFGKDYYKGKNSYLNLGIDEYNEYDDGIKKGYYTSDEYLVDKTIEKLQTKEKNQKLFYMNCTIQSHMPFVKEKYENYDINIVESTLPDNLNEVILSYAQGAYDADKSLGKMYEFIKNFDEPTILLFFGDHLPYLEDYKTDEVVFDRLSYFNTGDNLLDTYRKYNTQALVLANYDISDFDIGKCISPDLLLTSVLNNIDVEVNPYYYWLFENSKELSSTNFIVSQDSNGNIMWTSSISDSMKKYMEYREKMQYRLLLDN